MTEELPIYNRATNNVGNPPHAEAYCRVLAMEVERLAREDERLKIAKIMAKVLCEDCRNDVPKDVRGRHVLMSDDMVVPCKAAALEGLR